MFYKINGNEIEMCGQNGVLKDGTAISNMPKYFERTPNVAAENGYYPLKEDDGSGAIKGYAVDCGMIKAVYESEEDI